MRAKNLFWGVIGTLSIGCGVAFADCYYQIEVSCEDLRRTDAKCSDTQCTVVNQNGDYKCPAADVTDTEFDALPGKVDKVESAWYNPHVGDAWGDDYSDGNGLLCGWTFSCDLIGYCTQASNYKCDTEPFLDLADHEWRETEQSVKGTCPEAGDPYG